MEQVFFKTAKGREELVARSLIGKLRALLIMINGQDSLQTLHAKFGPETSALVHELERLGHVETHTPQNPELPKRPSPGQSPAPATPVAVAATTAAAPVAAGKTQLRAMQEEAIRRLIPHFGPDAESAAKPLLDATNIDAFFVAIKGIEQRLAIYVGKAHAARILAGLRG